MTTVVTYDLRSLFDTSSLSPEERARLERFRSSRAERRWAAGRVGLRRVLGEAVGTDPAALVLVRGPHGKPALAGSTLRFNKSDSGDLAVVAMCPDREVGIDVERHRTVTRAERIAARFFAPEERAQLDSLSGDARTRGFFDCWTAKEAVLKCDGGGLGAIPMASYSAPLDAQWSGPVGDRWWMARLDLGADLSAAVVIAGTQPAELQVTSPPRDASARE